MIQATHFICEVNSSVLSSEFVIYPEYGFRLISGVSILVKRSLDAIVDLVHDKTECVCVYVHLCDGRG